MKIGCDDDGAGDHEASNVGDDDVIKGVRNGPINGANGFRPIEGNPTQTDRNRRDDDTCFPNSQ